MNTQLLEQIVAGEAPDLMSLSVEQYHQMLEAGIFQDGDPVELIDGLLVWKDRRDAGKPEMNHGPSHASGVRKLFRAIDRSLDSTGYYAQCQLSITVPPRHEPEPDVSIIVGTFEDFEHRHPAAADTYAVMEVASSSVRFDRTTKLRMYADAGIPVYWLVDLVAGRVEVYSQPLVGQGRYERQEVFTFNDTLNLLIGDQTVIEIPASDFLP